MYTLTEIWIYPIKSLGGISLSKALVQEQGLKYDRRWMVVDTQGRFLTQRSEHGMALIDVSFGEGGLAVTHRAFEGEVLIVPFQPLEKSLIPVTVWDDQVQALTVSPEADRQLSKWLGREVRLVMMPDGARRPVDPDYARNGETVSFADGYPLLLIGQSSLDDLNERLEVAVSMRRFRPNLVVSGAPAFEEDRWKSVRIGTARFSVVKPCARCVLTTLDPATGIAGVEPLKTLSTYRKRNSKIYFGQNLLAMPGQIAVGDLVEIS
jgi:uncharacterized protein